jgi:ABC-type nickel/cobalt efflux system permease component RcnA
VPGAVPSLLLATAAATAAFHTLIPDHWLPFVLVGRARGWSARTTAAVSGFSAFVHTLLSIALGLLALGLGQTAARAIGERLERGSGLLLVVFGVAYALWAWRKGGHFHPGGALLHARNERDRCDGHEGFVESEHLHYHADDAWIRTEAAKGAIPLAMIVGLNPCILLLPIMVATAEEGAGAIALVTVAYSVTTIALMVGLSVAGVAGTRRLHVPAVARHMETASGILIALCGAVFLLIER